MNYSGLWNNEYGENYSALSDDVFRGNAYTALRSAFANRIYGRAAVREIIYALVGAAPGATASASHKRVQAERDLEANVQGGARTIQTFVSINRATDSDDEDRVQGALRAVSKPNPYPVDRAGNGGGNKLGW